MKKGHENTAGEHQEYTCDRSMKEKEMAERWTLDWAAAYTALA